MKPFKNYSDAITWAQFCLSGPCSVISNMENRAPDGRLFRERRRLLILPAPELIPLQGRCLQVLEYVT